MLGLLRTTTLTYESRADVGGGVCSFAFRPERPLRARAGQHGVLGLSLTANKPFTLASAPHEPRVLIGTSLASGSAFKTRLAALEPGDTVTLRGPVNAFTLDGAGDRVVLLAQGVGITPMRSMLAAAVHAGGGVASTLVHVASAGHAYREETEAWATSAAFLQHADAFRTAATDAAHDQPGATFFVAGHPAFVSSTASLLRGAGVPRKRIREDKYWLSNRRSVS